MSNFYPFPAFKNRFGDEVDPDGGNLVSARWQTIIGNGVQAGSIIGLLINGYVTEWIGYRKTMIGAMIFMIGGIFIPFFSTGLPMFLAGALVQGLPWGIFQTLSVTYAADLCPTKLRQYMTSCKLPNLAFCTRTTTDFDRRRQHLLGCGRHYGQGYAQGPHAEDRRVGLQNS